MNSLCRLADILEGFSDLVGRITAWLTLGLVLVVAVNVLMRYLFKIGSVATQELEWHLQLVFTLLGLSYVLRHDGHVRIDILYQYYGKKTRIWMELVTAVLIYVPLSLVIVYLSLNFVDQSYVCGEKSPDPGGLPFRFVLKSFIPAAFLLLAVQGAGTGLRNALLLIQKRHGV